MPNNIQKVIEEGVNEFDEKFDICNNPDHGFIYGIGGQITRLGCPGCGGKWDDPKLFIPSEIKSHIRTTITNVLQAIEEEVRKLDLSGSVNGKSTLLLEDVTELLKSTRDSVK